jgi:hypothetical protein
MYITSKVTTVLRLYKLEEKEAAVSENSNIFGASFWVGSRKTH